MKIVDSTKVEYYKKEMNLKMEKKDLKNEEKKDVSVKQSEDKIDISLLKEESEKAYAHLRRIVEDLLQRQGYSIEQLGKFKHSVSEDSEELGEKEWLLNSEDIKVDQKARDEAQQMIGEGGPLSAESVSTRIVDFAKAISNGDRNKFELLRGAIEEGFEQAKEYFGGELPEISQETYDLVQEKLDAWYKEE